MDKDKKMHIYYDAESDYLEIRFGEPTPSHYEKIGSDTYVRLEEGTEETKGYAIFNVKQSSSPLKTIDVEIPLSVLKAFKDKHKQEAN